MTLEIQVDKYIDALKKYRVNDLKLKAIKNILTNKHNEDKFKTPELLQKKGVYISQHEIRKYKLKNSEVTKDFLWDLGILPMVVNLNRVLKTIDIENAIIDTKESVRLYTGRNKLIDLSPDDFEDHYEHLSLEELSEEFLSEYTRTKTLESEKDSLSNKVLKIMDDEGESALKIEGIGNLRITQSVEVDPVIIFEALRGKKEIFLKKNQNNIDVLIFPEKQKAVLPKDFNLLDFEVREIYKKAEKNPIVNSLYIKKSEVNKLKKDGFIGTTLLAELNPEKFFKSLDISKTKIEEYIEIGLLDENFIDEHYEVEVTKNENGEPKLATSIIPEGVQEMRREMFLNKLSTKNLSQEQIKEAQQNKDILTSSLVNVDVGEFSF